MFSSDVRILIIHRWLVTHDRTEEAVQIIADLEDKDVSDPFVQLQMNQIQYSVEYEKTNSVSFSDILRGKTHEKAGTKTVRRLLLGMTAQAMQQFSGINVTSYYLPTVLTKSVGLDESLARLLTACNSVQYLLFSLIGIPNVERWGRRMLMIFGATGMCFCYIFITALIRYNEMPGYAHSQEVASASVAFFFLYYVFFGIGMQGVPWRMFIPCLVLSSLPNIVTSYEDFLLTFELVTSIPNRNQLPHNANKRCRAGRSHKLDLQLHGRRDYARWN